MKKLIKYMGVAALSFGLLTSCNEDDHTGLSQINYTAVPVTLSSSENNSVLSEDVISADGYSIDITATIIDPVPVDLHIPLVQTAGNADANDYEFSSSNTIVIPAGSTMASTTLIIHATGNTEGDESLTISSAPAAQVANAIVSPFELNIDIVDDYVDYSFNLDFEWDGYVFPEDPIEDSDLSFCDGLDVDFYFLNSSFSDTGIYDAATGACPEHLSIDASAFADGTYYIYADLWSNAYTSAGYGLDVPLTFTYSQGVDGEFYAENVSSPTFKYNTDDSAGAGDFVMEFEIVSGIVTSVTVY